MQLLFGSTTSLGFDASRSRPCFSHRPFLGGANLPHPTKGQSTFFKEYRNEMNNLWMNVGCGVHAKTTKVLLRKHEANLQNLAMFKCSKLYQKVFNFPRFHLRESCCRRRASESCTLHARVSVLRLHFRHVSRVHLGIPITFYYCSCYELWSLGNGPYLQVLSSLSELLIL